MFFVHYSVYAQPSRLYLSPFPRPSGQPLLGLSGGGLLLLVEEPLDAPGDALLQGPAGLVAQDAAGLGDVEVARHARHGDLLLVEGGRLADDVAANLAQDAEDTADGLAEVPGAVGAGAVAGGGEDGAGKVPEVDRGVVGDEEGLAVDLFVVEGRGRGGGGGEEEAGGQEVGVGDVADVGEVEEVEVVANLDLVLAVVVGAEEAGEGLAVGLAKDAGGADGAGQELGGLGAVGLEDGLFGGGLEGGGRKVSMSVCLWNVGIDERTLVSE